VGAEIFTNFWCFVHNCGYRYTGKSFKGYKDADFGLVSEKILSHKNGPIGWGLGTGKCSQKHLHLWCSPLKTPYRKRKIVFFDFDYKTCWNRRGFKQLSSSIAWQVAGLQSSAWNVVFAGLKGLIAVEAAIEVGFIYTAHIFAMPYFHLNFAMFYCITQFQPWSLFLSNFNQLWCIYNPELDQLQL